MPAKTAGSPSSSQPARLLRDRARAAGAGRDREQHGGRRPAEVDQRTLRVGAAGDLVQVEAVAGAEDHEPDREVRPGAVGPPAGQRERPGHQRDEQRVGERVREVRQRARDAALRRLEHVPEDRRGRDRARPRAPRSRRPPTGSCGSGRLSRAPAGSARGRRAGRTRARTRPRSTGTVGSRDRRARTSSTCCRPPMRPPRARSATTPAAPRAARRRGRRPRRVKISPLYATFQPGSASPRSPMPDREVHGDDREPCEQGTSASRARRSPCSLIGVRPSP